MEKGICKWDKIQPLNNITPPHRTSHSAVVVNDRYIFIIGGEGYHIVSSFFILFFSRLFFKKKIISNFKLKYPKQYKKITSVLSF